MSVNKKTQKAGGSCGAANNKMKMRGGAAHSAANNKMKMSGGAAHSAANNKMKMNVGGGTKKSSHKLAKDEANCFKCKSAGKKFHVKFINPVNKTVKNSKRTVKGISAKCPVCGGKVFKIVGA